MNQADDRTLTEFLIRCMGGIFKGDIQPTEKPVIPAKNVRQYVIREDDLLYLETSSGDMYRTESTIRVFAGNGDERRQIWCMQIFAVIDPKALHALGMAALSIHAFLKESRLLGFEHTLRNMKRSDRFCLLDIPMRTTELAEPGRATAGRLMYRENINDDLSAFMGSEAIHFTDASEQRKRVSLFQSYVQGGRT